MRLVSPASTPERLQVDYALRVLTEWGLVAEVASHAFDAWGYMAGTDEDRLADLNGAFRDPGVRAVFATRGGAGAYRIADAVDFDAVRDDPKPLIGFSDITYLHLALWKNARLRTIHGCLGGTRVEASVRQLLMTSDPYTLHSDPSAYSAAIRTEGRATGFLVGGQLTPIATSVGSQTDLDGAIFFIEELKTRGLGLFDRQLTQLIRAGAFQNVRGVAIGLLESYSDHTDRGWTLLHVLQDRLGGLGIPVLGGFFAGHGGIGADGRPDMDALALGARAELDVDAGTLTVGLPPHQIADRRHEPSHTALSAGGA